MLPAVSFSAKCHLFAICLWRYHTVMAASTTLIPVDEYLQTNYKPACEYREGILTQKPMPTYNHSETQFAVSALIRSRFPEFKAGPELTVRLSESRFLVPDVAVQDAAKIQSPYPTEAIHLCVEILSPNDRLSEVIAKGEEYHAWGVPTVWIIDPDQRTAWQFTRNHGLHEIPAGGTLTAAPIAIPVDALFG